jgi:hypothetical protein
MMSEAARKQTLFAEITIYVNSLNERAGAGGVQLIPPSQEEVDKLTISELEAMKREFRDQVRSLGGLGTR